MAGLTGFGSANLGHHSPVPPQQVCSLTHMLKKSLLLERESNNESAMTKLCESAHQGNVQTAV